ncbi:zinc finger protein ZAT5-like [Pyrus x bretschneideri]|uniref:zinc finger protein ZAT5-like n=1 Tax=Pyrus x bretschneideri TaxID=225117 RepID=UPI002030E9FB|nr:zinc finger protein ZAT5-like [Pyrus x bretschneideri]
MMMMMEAADHQDQDEAVLGYKDQAQMMIIKGKRTKRQRLASPLSAIATTASSSSSVGYDHDHLQHEGLVGPRPRDSTDVVGPTASPASSADQFTEISTEEEEDMANCLILLAQGNSIPKPQNPSLVNNNKAASAAASTGLCLYQCKTCDRCFPSFQALGGHRASHKKPGKQVNINSTTQENKKALSFVEEAEEFDRFNNTSTMLSLQISNTAFRALSSATSPCYNNNNNKANKVHECSVCGAEFISGQALGGHMRRHRTFINTAATTAVATMSSPPQSQSGSKRPRNVLQLDLNLPAPEEERLQETNKFPFGPKKEQVIIFSACPLVGCHY